MNRGTYHKNKQIIIRVIGVLFTVIFSIIILLFFQNLTTSVIRSIDFAELDTWTIPRIMKITGEAFILVFLLFLSICLSAHRKIVVLYLRKFRLNTEIISPKNKGRLGKSVRTITLQDQIFPSMALTLKDKITSFTTTLMIFIIPILVIYFLVIGSIKVISEGNFFYPYAAYFIMFYIGWICITIFLFISFFIARLNLSKVIRITKHDDIETVKNKVSSLKLFVKRLTFMGSRSTIVETTNQLWKDTVSSLIKRCNVALIDVSQLNNNIMWEIEECISNKISIILIYTADVKAQLSILLNSNAEGLSNIPTLKIPVGNEKESIQFRHELTKLIIENNRNDAHLTSIGRYHLKSLLIYSLLFLLAMVLASLITYILAYTFLK